MVRRRYLLERQKRPIALADSARSVYEKGAKPRMARPGAFKVDGEFLDELLFDDESEAWGALTNQQRYYFAHSPVDQFVKFVGARSFEDIVDEVTDPKRSRAVFKRWLRGAWNDKRMGPALHKDPELAGLMYYVALINVVGLDAADAVMRRYFKSGGYTPERFQRMLVKMARARGRQFPREPFDPKHPKKSRAHKWNDTMSARFGSEPRPKPEFDRENDRRERMRKKAARRVSKMPVRTESLRDVWADVELYEDTFSGDIATVPGPFRAGGLRRRSRNGRRAGKRVSLFSR